MEYKVCKSSLRARENSRNLYYRNRAKRLRQTREWAKRNPEKVYSYLKKWRSKEENKKKMNLYSLNYSKWWRKSPRGRTYYFLRKYGITCKEYKNLYKKQNGKCAICFRKVKEYELAVDHNHNNKKVRGLLCKFCNQGIGFLKEDIGLFQNAIKYLKDYEAVSDV